MSQQPSRREMIQSLCGGLGSVGLLSLLAADNGIAGEIAPHFPATAKHVIFIFLAGGPSQLDMFDPKPLLLKYQGQRPAAVSGFRTERETGGLLPSPFEFKKHGQSGMDVSELLPHTASVIDDLCVIRSMYTFNPTHTQGRNLATTGTILANRPTIGAWASYGLGSENQNLPSYVVLTGNGENASVGRAGFLPAEHQGVALNTTEPEPEKMVRYLRNANLPAQAQRGQLDLVQTINAKHRNKFGEDAFLDGRIKSLEAAYKLQFEASDALDIRTEPQTIRNEYGSNAYGDSCLMARRLVERGVRFIHLYPAHREEKDNIRANWDDHQNINKALIWRCQDMDRAAAALVRDLKRRGLLDNTLVAWGGEFGRTPVSEAGDGRDHNPFGYTMWLAGGGVKGGLAYGATDEFGFKAVENRVSIHDLHATILHTLGLDHKRLTYKYAGRDFRLTDVHGEVVRDILA